MAVNKTGAIFKSLTFDGESSRDYGIYITGEAVFNAPEREVEMITIPNRNGAFALDKGRFENIEVTYPAGVFADSETDFAKAISDFRNMLCSRKGYCRLTDEYNPDEFRLAVYKSGLEVDPVALRAGEFDITFECKPQRYLMSGENKFIVGEWGDTDVETGDIVEIDNTSGAIEVKSAEINLKPKQAGTPWQDSTLNTVPYNFKASPQLAHSYNSEYDTLVGASVCWNQLVQNGNFASADGWSATYGSGSVANNIYTYTLSQVGAYYQNRIWRGGINYVAGHKYLMSADVKSANAIRVTLTSYSTQDSAYVIDAALLGTSTAGSKSKLMGIATAAITAQSDIRLEMAYNGKTIGDTVEFSNIMLIDLTALFANDPSIADYIYTLEQGQAGAGVAFFKKLFPKPYYAYNAGELMSVQAVSHNTVGFNVWDEETELGYINNSTGENVSSASQIRGKNYIPVIPNTTYYFKSPTGLFVYFYDANKGYIGVHGSGTRITNNTITLGADVHYIRVSMPSDYGTTYNNDICINFHYDGERDGEYEPHKKTTYPLGEVELRGLYKLVNGQLQAYGDRYPADGNIEHIFGAIAYDGSSDENWSYSTDGNGNYRVWIGLGTAKPNNWTNLISDKYLAANNGSSYPPAGMMMVNSTPALIIGVPSTITSASDWKTYLASNPSVVYYELATPTTETTDPYQNPQTVDNWGTEYYEDGKVTAGDRDVAVPVGHETIYGEFYEITGGADEVTITVADDPDNPTESEDYTTNLGQYVAGGSISMLDGVGTVTYGKIDFYNGESINEPWLSNLDEYTQGGTPTTGACVVYPLTTPTTLSLTPVDIELYDGIINYLWSEEGTVTIEYGNGPDFIVNPTLFGCGPLIEAKGYGDIEFNGYKLSLEDGVIGDTLTLENESQEGEWGTAFTPVTLNTGGISQNGDTITVDSTVQINRKGASYVANLKGSVGTPPTTGTASFFPTSASLGYSDSRESLINIVSTFTKGTSSTSSTGQVLFHIEFLNKQDQMLTSGGLTVTYTLAYNPSDDTITPSISLGGDTYDFTADYYSININSVYVDSSVTRLGDPTYIDCDLGEAYKIENGEHISLNKYIDLGSDLPEFAPGSNKIVHDNTFTEVAVTPRWYII